MAPFLTPGDTPFSITSCCGTDAAGAAGTAPLLPALPLPTPISANTSGAFIHFCYKAC